MSHTIGIALVVLASAFFASAGLFVQFASPLASSWVALFAGLAIGAVAVLPYAIIRRGLSGLKTDRPFTYLARGLVSVGQVGTLFLALHSIPLTDALLLRETAPLWLPILSAIFLGEPMPARFWGAIAFGFFGVALVLHPKLGTLTLGYLVAVLNGILFAVQSLLTRRLNKLGEPQTRILFYIYLIGTAAAFGPAVATFAPLDLTSVVWLGLSGLCLLASTGCLVVAFGAAPAWLLAPAGYSAVIFAALLDWLVLGTVPDFSAAAGMVIVVASGIAIILLSRHSRHASPAPGAHHP
ncbi:MAG: DMT family transporter [Devosia sp.]